MHTTEDIIKPPDEQTEETDPRPRLVVRRSPFGSSKLRWPAPPSARIRRTKPQRTTPEIKEQQQPSSDDDDDADSAPASLRWTSPVHR
ncbi:MAG: hypothetical protein AAFX99_02190 [Myxococcota bacterium]